MIHEYLSFSQLNMFMRCSAQYRFRYDEGIIAPPTSALILGSSFHASHAKNFKQKVESHEDMRTSDLLEYFSEQFDAGKHDAVWYSDEDPGKIKDDGVSIVRHYHETASPGIQPNEVEFKFVVKVVDMPDFLGYIDCITDEFILELKTSSRTPSAITPENMLQATAYEAGLMTQGRGKGKVRIDYAVKTKTPKVITFNQQIETKHITFLLRLLPQVWAGIQSGIAIPNRTNNFLCSERWCGYWNMCHNIYGG